MNNLREKKRIVDLMDKFSGDKSISVKDLITKFSVEIDKYDNKEKVKESKVIEDFSGVYLKYIDKDRMFGQCLEVIKIDSLEVYSYTEDYTRLYMLSGQRILFSSINVHVRDFDNSVSSTYTETDLRECTQISADEYQEYLDKYNSLKSQIDEIIKI